MHTLLRYSTFALGLMLAAPALAHPHVWVKMKSQVVYAPDGSVTGVQQAWAFDDMLSVTLTQGLPQKTPGVFTREELADVAEVNITTLKDSEYFTLATADGKDVKFITPRKGEYWLDFKDGILTLNFLLPLEKPVKAKTLEFEIFDPDFFIDFSFDKAPAVSLAGAPSGCKLNVELPPEITQAQSQRLSKYSADEKVPGRPGEMFSNKIKVVCP